jgi:hypothetical protein
MSTLKITYDEEDIGTQDALFFVRRVVNNGRTGSSPHGPAYSTTFFAGEKQEKSLRIDGVVVCVTRTKTMDTFRVASHLASTL